MAKRPVIAAAALMIPIAALGGCSTGDDTDDQTTSATSAPARTERLTAALKTPDGTPVANATFDFANGFATMTVESVEGGVLRPGFHGMHIHSVGKCEANSVAPTGGEPGDFLSAGGHFQAPGHTGHPASGDLTALPVRSDGSAQLVMTTDAFSADDLLVGEGTALMIHEDEDNFAHIPERYTQPNGSPGPDQDTLATGDAGARVACGVIESTSATTTTTTTTTTPTTTTTTTTTPATVTETTVISPTTEVVPPPVIETTTTAPAETTATSTTAAETTTSTPVDTTTSPEG